MGPEDAPEAVDLDSLSNLYEKVEFNHSMHVDITEGDCSVCHHWTTGTPVKDPRCIKCHYGTKECDRVACSDCHAADVFSPLNLEKLEDPELHHKDKPGLKAVYHLNCRGCHVKMDGPTGCTDCHAMTEKGEAFYHTGKYAPKGGHRHGHHE